MVRMVPCDWFCQVRGSEGQGLVETGGSDRLRLVRESVSFLSGRNVCGIVHRKLVKRYC